VDFTFNHARHRKRSPENTRSGALSYEAALRQKLTRGEAIDTMSHATQQDQIFEAFAWRWFEEYVLSNNRYSEQLAKKYILASSVIPFFGKMPIGQITSYHIEQYKAQLTKQGVASKTIKNRLTVLNKCLTTAYEWLELKAKPPKITWPKCASYRTDYLSYAECELLLSYAEGVLNEMILTALRTGMRLGELKGLQWSSLDWENRSVWVRHSRCEYSKILVPPSMSTTLQHIASPTLH
jgi:integrase